MTMAEILQQRAFHAPGDEARQNHQKAEAPRGFAGLSKTQL
jgi:hypothetical protein